MMLIKGYDTRGRAVMINFNFDRLLSIDRVDLHEKSAVIYDRRDPDISISLKDWERLKPLIRPDAKIYEGDIPTNHVETVYDMRAYHARIILATLDALPLGHVTDAELKAAVEARGFVYSETRGWHIPKKEAAPAAKLVQKSMF